MLLDGKRWVMLSINKIRIVQNVALVLNRRKRKSPNVDVLANVLASSDIKTGTSIMRPSFPLILRRAASKYFTEIESEYFTVL